MVLLTLSLSRPFTGINLISLESGSSLFLQMKHLRYSKTCLKRPLKRTLKIGFQYRSPLDRGQKYCRMLQGEHSAIHSTSIMLLFPTKTLVLSFFKWPLKTGFTVYSIRKARPPKYRNNSKLIFLFLNQNIHCGYSKEPSQQIL